MAVVVWPAAGEPVQPLRLTQERFHEARGLPVAPLVLPLDERWKIQGPHEIRDRALVLAKGAAQNVLARNITLDAQRYNALRVEMRVEEGAVCRLNWIGDIEPEYRINPGASARLVPGDEFHTYLIPLWQAETWSGIVRQIQFYPAYNIPTKAEIRRIEFAYVPRPAPLRVTLTSDRLETMEALPGHLRPWRLQVPESAVFEVSVGMRGRAWTALKSDGARFVVRLTSTRGKSQVLVDKTLNPVTNEDDRNWVTLRSDLSAYEGQRVILQFEIDNLLSNAGDHVLWGNPMIFGPGTQTPAVPVILISLDTVRAGHLSLYGYERPTTPNLQAWAKQDAVVFENAVSGEPWTLPAHASMFTGLYPKNHRVTANTALPERVATLAEVLREQGYLAAGFTGISWWLAPQYGFSQGFDVYNNARGYRTGVRTLEFVYQWLDKHQIDRMFLFVHNFDAHSKDAGRGYKLAYIPEDKKFLRFSKALDPAPAFAREGIDDILATDFLKAANSGKIIPTSEEMEYLKALYDDSILYVDATIQALFEDLKRRGLYDNALIILTADHGEAFREHGLFLHEDTYATCSRVPLLIKFPENRFAGRRYEHVVQLTDIYATVLDVLNVPAPAKTDGRSLQALLEGTAGPRRFAYSRHHKQSTVRTDTWKLIHHFTKNGFELYNVTKDPSETRNRWNEAPPILPALLEELERFHRPDETGWHVALRGGQKPCELNVILDTPGRFIATSTADHKARTRGRVNRPEMKDAQRFEKKVLLKPGDDLEWTLQTVGPMERIRVRIEANGPFRTNITEQASNLQSRLEVVLDAGFVNWAKPPIAASNAGAPSIHFWYVPPAESASVADSMPAQQRAELEALGYLQ